MKQALLQAADYAKAVAPHGGAWIETVMLPTITIEPESHPTGVRGLKHDTEHQRTAPAESHPTGVRGLKLARVTSWMGGLAKSHPTGVRGLKHS